MKQYIDLRIVILTKLNRQKTKYILAGDYNINLLHYDNHSETERLLNHIFSNSCLPTITRPTRFSASTFALIDNIIYKIDKLQNITMGQITILKYWIQMSLTTCPYFIYQIALLTEKTIEKPKFKDKVINPITEKT